jgi:hypothetical protein
MGHSILSLLIIANIDFEYIKLFLEKDKDAECIIYNIKYPILYLYIQKKADDEIIKYLLNIGKDPLEIINPENSSYSILDNCLDMRYTNYIDIFISNAKNKSKISSLIHKRGDAYSFIDIDS